MSHVVITYFLFSQAIVVEFMKWGTQQGKQGPQRHIPLHNQVAENREWMLRAGTDVATILAFFPPLRPAANSVWYLDILCIEQKPWIWHIFYLKSGSVFVNPQTQSPHTKSSKYLRVAAMSLVPKDLRNSVPALNSTHSLEGNTDTLTSSFNRHYSEDK